MRRFPSLALVLLVAVTSAAPLVGQPASDTLARQVDARFASYNRSPSPGLAIAVVRDGRIVLSRGYGLASMEHRVAITPTTVFDVASVSKQFAGMAIAMLVEGGKISLDDDIRRWIPELPDFGRTITVRHLVHHISGLRDWPGTLAVAGWRFDDVISFDQILTMAFHQRTLNFDPGAEYTYSNTGYNLLAELVRRVTGQSFREWTDAQLFRPLGMTRSIFRDDHTRVIPDRAFGYARSGDSTYRIAPNNLMALGSSSMFSTAEDLARWVINFEEGTVGGRAVLERLRTRGVLNDGSTIAYAYGLSHGEHRGLPTIGHSGSWAQFSTYLVHFPQQRFGVVVLANSGSINASQAAFAVADIFLERELGPATPPVAARNDGATSAPTPAMLDDYVGLYRLGPGWYVRIRRNSTSLTTQASREGAFPMTPTSANAFWVEQYRAPMSFARNTPGTPMQLAYRGRTYEKVAETAAPDAAGLGALAGAYVSDELESTYHVEVRDGGLVMRHRRHGAIPLTHLWRDDFTGPLFFTRSIEFERDASGRVTGFLVNVDERSRNIRFRRM